MNNKIVEIIANSILTISGIIIGICFATGENPNTAVSIIMFSVALASILYQFLGGIGKETSIQLGILKFGGSAAILVGFMFFLDNYIYKDAKMKIHQDLIPISVKDGCTVKDKDIYYSEKKEQSNLTTSSPIRNHSYTLSETDQDYCFDVFIADERVGFVKWKDITTNTLGNKIEIQTDKNSEIQDFKLYPDNVKLRSTRQIEHLREILPFVIELDGSSYFKIYATDTIRSLINKGFCRLIPEKNNEYWLVMLVHADLITEEEAKYTKWVCKKVRLGFEIPNKTNRE